MGVFSKIFRSSKELTKISNAVVNAKVLLDLTEESTSVDSDIWLIIAWVCRVGIIDIIEKNHWPLEYILFVPINGSQVKMTLYEATAMSIGRLNSKADQLDWEIQNKIESVFNKGEWFYEIEKKIPYEKKALIL